MSNARVVTGLSLLVLSSCSMLGGLSSKGGSSAPSPTAAKPSAGSSVTKVDAPIVKADPGDSQEVERAIDTLDALEKLIGAKDLASYARDSRNFRRNVVVHGSLKGEKKRDALLERLDALDTAALAAVGGRLAKIGDAKRVATLDSDAVEAAQAMVDACVTATKTNTTGRGESKDDLGKAIAAYEKAMARAIKLDANALHYSGSGDGSGLDVPTQLLECEFKLAKVAVGFEDEYAPEVAPKLEDEVGCGVVTWTAQAVLVGGNQFSEYTRTVAGGGFLKAVPCKSIPARSKFPKALAGAVSQFAEYNAMPAKQLIQIADGRPTTEVSKEDLHTYRYQTLRAYSKAYKFTPNPCGDKMFCEAGGSQAMQAYNRLEFSLDRAAVHAGNLPDRCRAHLKDAKSRADWFAEFHAEEVKYNRWIAGAKYKTKKGTKLSEKQLIAAFADGGALAESRLDEKYCSKPAK